MKIRYRTDIRYCVNRAGTYVDCGINPAFVRLPVIEAHSCPFKGEIHDDYETLCWCPEEDEYQCSQDI